jgi:hypothetical protein
MNVGGVAVAWFLRDDWSEWLAMDADFQPDYMHWRRRTEAAYQHYRATGVPIIKAVIRPAEFRAWATASGAGFGSQARATFAALKAREDG